MHKDAIKITVEVWVKSDDAKEAVKHLTKAAAETPVVAEMVKVSVDKF
jgi:hypothetical protein